MSKFLLTLAAAAVCVSAAAGAASAADLEPLGGTDVSYTAPERTWTGFYLGGLFGYSAGDVEQQPVGTSVEIDGLSAGIYAGYGIQLGNQLVLGVEGDLLASGLDGDGSSSRVDQAFEASIRGRAGVALDQYLLYGTGGLAVADTEVSDATSTDSELIAGYTVGTGVEGQVTDKVTARIEYRYTDYGDNTFDLPSGSTDVGIDNHSVRAGIGFKF